jgi:tetratricopeptide (TPR) repeat protein
MSKDKNKAQAAKPAAAKAPTAKPAPIKVPPLFRKIDWFVLAFTFGVVWIAYLLTLAPEQTLEDSGELCTASFYAGIPHPPGYPFWAIYSWLWTVILPFGNVAWRVEVGESFALAMACGLVGFMVSRGSSMLIEGIEELKTMNRQWENAICVVTGIVAGLLLGFDGFVWNEAVVINRISIFDVPWIMVVALCLLRWIYAPHQRRYLYIGMFFFGVCATIHQTMLVAAMGIEVCIAVALPRLGRDLLLGNSIVYGLGLLGMATGKVPALNDLSPMFQGIFHAVGIGSIVMCFWLSIKTKKLGTEWKAVIFMGLLWMLGAAFYFYEPLAGMTDPPMQWGYPRTVEGFFHALSRGQYEKANPTDIIHDPGRFMMQLGMLVSGLASSFSWVYIFVALLPFFFLLKMKNRERAWIIGLTSIYLCIGVLLTIIMNTTPDRQSADENKVFFAASHAVVAIMIGYGLALMSAYMATHYEKFRRWGLLGGGIAVVLALYCLVDAMGKNYFGPAGRIGGVSEFFHGISQAFVKDQYALPVFANLILVATPLVFIASLLFYRNRAPVLIALCIFAAAPVYSGLSHWYKSEQRNHWFGYWFGHDMFTPPFTDPKTGKLSYDNTLRAELLKNPENAKIIYPEMTRNTILFGGTDPGRFCPTYAIFCDSFIPHDCQPLQDQKFDRRDVYLITQNALADGTYLDYLRAQYNRSQQIDPPFFREFLKYILGIPFGPDSSFVNAISEASYHLLDVPFTKLGAKIEARRRAEGVYPPKEIYIPSPEDSQDCFQQYTEDVARRQQLGQLRPGEDVSVENGRVQVSGQVAVMMINGLLCKVIFDRNPTNEFYVEESFPLDWMYPYETPFGIIMKVNRDPQPELTEDVLNKDHEFWSKYCERTIGNWIGYDTSIKQIADFAEKVYLGNNYAGFTGDRKFIRDDDAQKAFSKLRSSQAGMYAWRLNPQLCPPEYRQKTEASTQALIREADFAFKQSFAFCPYSPEAVFRYVNFLLQFGRIDDALIVAQTCQKLDPYNDQIIGLVKQLGDFQKQSGEHAQEGDRLQQMEKEASQNPADVDNLLQLGGAYLQMQQTNRAIELFDQVLAAKVVSYSEAATIAQFYSQSGNLPKLEGALQKIVAIVPTQPEPRYDLAALEAVLGQNSDSLSNLQAALAMSAARLKTNPAALDLLTHARADARLNSLRTLPEFQKIVPPN